ncbi:general odorant-binding protein 69a [Orussus abietinus]|uniref:general odorant-binding protein 69a n=1 Tax=Orussus abietinus TaxID=222816 RepID=UPI00062549C8|nr:general odorant-binding protein 69a [Orussus abietinus]
MRRYVSLVLGLCAVGVCVDALTQEQVSQFGALHEKCIQETGVDPNLLARAQKGEALDDRKVQCFGACLLQGMNIMDASGAFSKENAVALAPENFFRGSIVEMINTCGDQKGADACETAGKVFECMNGSVVFGVLKTALGM